MIALYSEIVTVRAEVYEQNVHIITDSIDKDQSVTEGAIDILNVDRKLKIYRRKTWNAKNDKKGLVTQTRRSFTIGNMFT